jgi:hypothetical protein
MFRKVMVVVGLLVTLVIDIESIRESERGELTSLSL